MAVAVATLPTAESLLRPYWVELNKRLDPLPVADELYILEILSQYNMETLKNSSLRSRSEGARELLHLMILRSWEEAVVFAGILARTPGIKDLGERILFQAGMVVD